MVPCYPVTYYHRLGLKINFKEVPANFSFMLGHVFLIEERFNARQLVLPYTIGYRRVKCYIKAPDNGILWDLMVQYGMVWYSMVRYGTVWLGMVWYGAPSYQGQSGRLSPPGGGPRLPGAGGGGGPHGGARRHA